MLGALNQYTNIYQATGSVSSDPQRKIDTSKVNPEVETQKSNQNNETRAQALPGQDKTNLDGSQRDSVELSQEALEIRKLQVRDREVRAHETAHAAAGGAYAGSPTYTFERGPDGQPYAVGGAVSIDISPIKGDPQATLQKAQQIRAAALAPAEPSVQDMKVAQKAQAMASTARMEVSQELEDDLNSIGLESNSNIDSNPFSEEYIPEDIASTGSSVNQTTGFARLSIYS